MKSSVKSFLRAAKAAMLVVSAAVFAGCGVKEYVDKGLDQRRVPECLEVISTIETSLNAYYADHGRLPDSLEALVDNEEPYLIGGRDKLMDPWGTKIDYKPGQRGNFELRSAGPDCVLGNDDDITNNH